MKYGTEKQIEAFAKPFLYGDRIGCFALSEPGSSLFFSYHHIILVLGYRSIGNGSDAGAASTLVKEYDSSTYIINGTKSWM